MLSASATTHDFGGNEIGMASPPFTWTITNAGDVASGPPLLTNSNSADFAVVNNCTAPLAGGNTCTMTIRYNGINPGLLTGNVYLTTSPGGTVGLSLSTRGLYRLSATATGTGTVTSQPTGIACPPTCSGLFSPGANVTLGARTTNGSGYFFSGWSGGGCSGPARDCLATVSAPITVAATFSPMTANLIFVSAALQPTNLGSAAAYDASCNIAATAAGINNTAGNAYIAFTSDAASLAVSRLGASARGWVRMDGRPFADTQASLFTNSQVWNVIAFSEGGRSAINQVATGTNSDGTLFPGNCANWTGSGQMLVGVPNDGPHAWVANSLTDCPPIANIICMGRTLSSPVAPLVTTGRRIWLSPSGFVPGSGQTPDAFCQAARPAGVTTAAALIAHPDRPASAVLDGAMNYVRVDGTLVARGSDLAAGSIQSGIWQLADSSYAAANTGVFTGQLTLTAVGTAATTCNDWTDPLGQAVLGGPTTIRSYWWSTGIDLTGNPIVFSCSGRQPLYCAQTAP
jgi:hypothetical protein